ncbi:hypothetical protein ACT691_13530 [Vibrio metschnikovii]
MSYLQLKVSRLITKITHNSKAKKISKASQVARCGNAVCPPVAQALVEANLQIKQLTVAA